MVWSVVNALRILKCFVLWVNIYIFHDFRLRRPVRPLGLPASAVAGTLVSCVCVCVPVLRMSRAARGPREVWAVSRPERSRYGRVGPRRLRDATRERPSGSGLFIVIGPGPSLRLRPQLCSQRAVSTTP